MNFSRDVKIAADLAAIAADARLEPNLSSTRGAVLAKTPVYAAGYGSIARPMADWLAKLGVQRFVLVDPKSYSEQSVASQLAGADTRRRSSRS
jgi:hypothetical protein